MDLDGDELNYVWKIDGNEYSDDEEFRHYFNDPGEYEVELSVSDGRSSSAVSEIVTVAEVNTPVLISKEHNFKVEIEYSLLNKSDTVLNEIECFMGIPQTYYPYQIVNGYSTNYPVEEELFDNDWNSIIHFKFDEEELGKDETISATAEFDITAFEFEIADLDRLSSESMENYDKNSIDYKKYTSDDLFIDSDSPEIKQVMEKLTGNIKNPLIISAILYDFVVKELSYDFQRAEDSSYEFLYASEILDEGKGVCADYAILYAALLRSAGIPARLSAGIPVYSILHENDKEIELGHAWLDIKFPGYGWLPVDITPEEEFLGPNYYLDIVREKGTGYLYENKTMDWERYYFDSFFYSWDSDSFNPDTEQKFEFRVKGINLEDIELDNY